MLGILSISFRTSFSQFWVLSSNSFIKMYNGGYSDWLSHGKTLTSADQVQKKETLNSSSILVDSDRKVLKTKLSYKLQRELDNLPSIIEDIEDRLEGLQAMALQDHFYDQPFSITQKVLSEISELEKQLEIYVSRWTELEEINSDISSSKSFVLHREGLELEEIKA